VRTSDPADIACIWALSFTDPHHEASSLVCCLTTVSVWRLYNVDYRTIYEYGAVCGMRIRSADWSILRKAAPVPFCPPQIPHDLTWDGTRAAEVGSQQLTAISYGGTAIACRDGSNEDFVLYHI
jgi:hypothetical protein